MPLYVALDSRFGPSGTLFLAFTNGALTKTTSYVYSTVPTTITDAWTPVNSFTGVVSAVLSLFTPLTLDPFLYRKCECQPLFIRRSVGSKSYRLIVASLLLTAPPLRQYIQSGHSLKPIPQSPQPHQLALSPIHLLSIHPL